MPLYTLNPGSNQTPDATLGGLAVTSPTNTGHASTTAEGVGGTAETKSCRWFSFPALTGEKKSVTLKVTHESSGLLSGIGALNAFQVDYSVNGGSSWTNAVARSNFASSEGPTTFSVALSVMQDLTQVQVRDNLFASTADVGESANVTVTISDIKLEVLTLDAHLLVMS